ncbi:MAG: hypothetical protein ABSF80_08520 [Chitinispirillaceae bacterium]|jgi:tRNA U34 2-thiouridine synthase MnmA/TrmU
MVRALGLLSGGLDSTLAAKLLIDQGIEVHAINFTSPFCTCTPKSAGCASILTAIKQLGDIPLKRIVLGDEYLDMVKSPRHGYGRGMNPCIDCRIMKIRKAAEYMREINASFLFTGEVLGQRPMSQHKRAIDIIDRESGMAGLTLRPLSARLFPPTLSEQNGWVDRGRLLAISGRARKPQIALALHKGINDFRCPAGGCLLTEPHFAARLKDYFDHCEKPSCADITLLKIGRHFRMADGGEIIVARDAVEGEKIVGLRRPGGTVLVPVKFSAPVVMFTGSNIAAAALKMAEYTNHKIPDDAEIFVADDEGSRKTFRGSL